ncbi:MAG: galactose mutarotase [Flavobacteriaceae bacterium]|nr:galactose mutarotase [Flavobacteriaceae bacterium]
MKNKNGFYSIKNRNGVEVEFTERGGKLMSYKVPTERGVTDIILGYSNYEMSEEGDEYFGGICGRVANRILGGKFTINEEEFQADQNIGNNTLHGGKEGFHKKIWQVNRISDNSYELSLESPHLDQGFPGNLSVKTTYTLTDDNELIVDFSATTDQDTIINLASHPYFNLKGKGDILDHYLELNAEKYTPMSEEFVPTGVLEDVKGTPFDFTKIRKVGDAIFSKDPQIILAGKGIDHNFVLDKELNELGLACKLMHPQSPIMLEVYTTQAGLQVYLAMHLDSTGRGKNGNTLYKYGGIALEAQNFPDAIHHSHFPSPILRKGEVYQHRVVYKAIVE